MIIPQRLRWYCQKRHKKEEKKVGYLKHLILVFSMLCFCIVAIPQVLNPEQLSASRTVWFAWKACSSVFYDYSDALWKTIFSFDKECFCQGYKYRPSHYRFYEFPFMFHSFHVLQMGPSFPNDNFSFPLTDAGLHWLASKVFVTASSLLSVSSSQTLCCCKEENDCFLSWQ